jgi:hypothetical protein
MLQGHGSEISMSFTGEDFEPVFPLQTNLTEIGSFSLKLL